MEEEHQAAVLEFCSSMLPGSQILLVAGTNITISAPRSITRIMPEFLAALEQKLKPVTRKVLEYAVANSTLEEVFM